LNDDQTDLHLLQVVARDDEDVLLRGRVELRNPAVPFELLHLVIKNIILNKKSKIIKKLFCRN
jgi:hypothetical protein